mmetsp:Transcript_18660/g.51182  ORF Transcript_18660/g.51182 Transcript_18660/m.51182 type:complete len:281 (-) Transcript_18660:212-1054(-)
MHNFRLQCCTPNGADRQLQLLCDCAEDRLKTQLLGMAARFLGPPEIRGGEAARRVRNQNCARTMLPLLAVLPCKQAQDAAILFEVQFGVLGPEKDFEPLAELWRKHKSDSESVVVLDAIEGCRVLHAHNVAKAIDAHDVPGRASENHGVKSLDLMAASRVAARLDFPTVAIQRDACDASVERDFLRQRGLEPPAEQIGEASWNPQVRPARGAFGRRFGESDCVHGPQLPQPRSFASVWGGQGLGTQVSHMSDSVGFAPEGGHASSRASGPFPHMDPERTL